MKIKSLFPLVALAVTLSVSSLPALGQSGERQSDPDQPDQEHPGFMAATGRVTFQRYCASCHGRQADGNGSIASVLKVRPADLRLLSVNNDGEFPKERVRRSIDGREGTAAHGRRDMPVWGEVFETPLVEGTGRPGEEAEDRSARKIRELVYFLETIQLEPPEDGE